MTNPFTTATELAASIRRGEITSAAALEVQLARVAAVDGPLNAVVTLDPDGARAAARAADDARDRGLELGPLHGLPMTVKDTWETAALTTTAGAPAFADHEPAADAAAVARLRAAGAVVFGKTNTPLMAMDVQTYNDVWGTTNNPWDPTRTSGGSSGGAAVAVATGMTPLELGSDIGGSIRTPAGYTGVYGHKPSWNVVPMRGHIPGPPGSLSVPDLGVGGPLARSAEDLDLAMSVLAGPDDWDATAWRLALPGARAQSLDGFRVAAWLDDDACPVDPAVRRRLEATVAALREAGVAVDTGARPALTLSDAVTTYLPLLGAQINAGLPEHVYDALVAGAAAAGDDQDPVARYARMMTVSARDRAIMNERRQQQRAAWSSFFTRFDVMMTPITAVPAIPHDHTHPMAARTIAVNGEQRSYLDLFSWIAPASAALLPATVAPAGRTEDGLPVGVQIIGPYLEDRTTIAFARLLGEVTEGFVPPPSTP